MNLHTIPAGINFLQTLADYVRADSIAMQTVLPDYMILLPSRRAVRTLQQLIAQNTPTLLPRIHAIGDLDDDVLTLQSPDLNLPPAINPHARLGLLMQLIQEQANMSWPRAQGLAEALIKLWDEATLREVPITALQNLVPENLAAHWQVSLNWLRVITSRWPEILAARGQVDATAARQNILNGYAGLWQRNPPTHPVIAAGSTGSLPATRRLLKTIAALPRGMVILPALDQNLPNDIWLALPDTHSQRPLSNLLADFEMTRDQVLPIGSQTHSKHVNGPAQQAALWQQVLLPADFTHLWREPSMRLIKSALDTEILSGIHTVTAPNAETEAQAIALILARAAREHKTAALITPDRTLAQRVSAKLARFDIIVNDSAGAPLSRTPVGRWMQLLLNVLQSANAVNVLSLLKHPLSCFSTTRAICRAAARDIEQRYFRRDAAPQNLTALLMMANEDLPLRDTLSTLHIDDGAKTFAEWMKILRTFAETLTSEPDDAPLAWQRESGEALWQLCLQLEMHSGCFPAMTLPAFAELLQDRMATVALHAPHAHPHIHILGLLEARLHHFDTIILGGMNESIWPAEPAPDPWLSRPLRTQIGLTTAEEMLGLAAHDFYQWAVQPEIYLTRSMVSEGAPTLPSRWLERLSAYVQACQLDADILEEKSLLEAAAVIDRAENFMPAPQPQPTPNIANRPRRFSPSSIETLMHNPYEFYARYILQLRVMPELNAAADGADQGNFLHEVLLNFTRKYPSNLPDDAPRLLDDLAQPLLTALALPAMEYDFWWQNWLRARHNFLHWQKQSLDAGRRIVATEHFLSYDLMTSVGPLKITTRADRIDVDAAGQFIIVDYKSKNAPTKTDVVNLTRPQLALEAWLLMQCGLEGHPPRTVAGAEFWPLIKPDAQIITPDIDNFAEAIAMLPDRLSEFLAHYLRAENPFTAAVPEKLFADQMPYVHLSRANEWLGVT